MRKLFLTAVIALLSIGAYAQKGQTYLGGQLAYPTDIESLGIGVKGGYGITDAIRAQATFDYFLKKEQRFLVGSQSGCTLSLPTWKQYQGIPSGRTYLSTRFC